MRKVLLLAALAACVATAASAVEIKTYTTEQEAMRVCRSPVVWINVNSMIYHVQGSRYYGNTKLGTYACQAAANRVGAHEAKNEH